MKKCNRCNITTDTNKNHCPLCFQELENIDDNVKPPLFSTKIKGQGDERKRFMLYKIMLFISICAIAICVFVNVITNKDIWWSLIVFLSIVYVWILVRHAIMSRRNIFEKVLFQFLSLLGIVLACNVISGGGDWFWNFVVPSAIMATTSVLMLITLIRERKSIVGVFVLILIFLIMSLILKFCHIDNYELLSEINIVYTSLMLLGIFIFDFKNLKSSFFRIFHV